MLASISTSLTPPLTELALHHHKISEIAIFAGIASDNTALLRNRKVDLAVTSDPIFEMEGLSRFPMLRERFVLLLPKSYSGPSDDLIKLAKSLPLIRYSPETFVGRRIDQHLRRVRLELPRSVEADRTNMVIATVATGLGFSIVSPTLLIDGIMEGMTFDIRPLPIPSLNREITLIARKDELGDLPAKLAKLFADVLRDRIERIMPRLPQDSVRLLYNRP